MGVLGKGTKHEDVVKSAATLVKDDGALARSDIDKATFFMMHIIQAPEYKPHLDELLEQMNNYRHLLPIKPGESPEHNRERKLSAISMAINGLHEEEAESGRNVYTLMVNDHDIELSFYMIKSELEHLNTNAPRNHRWADMISKAADAKILER